MQDETTQPATEETKAEPVITIALIARKLGLKPTGTGNYVGRNPLEPIDPGHGSFMLYGPAQNDAMVGTAYDPQLRKNYTALEIAQAAGMKPEEYPLYEVPLPGATTKKPEATSSTLIQEALAAYRQERIARDVKEADARAANEQKQVNLAHYAMQQTFGIEIDPADVIPSPEPDKDGEFHPLIRHLHLRFVAGNWTGHRLKLATDCAECDAPVLIPIGSKVALGEAIQNRQLCEKCRAVAPPIPDLEQARRAAADSLAHIQRGDALPVIAFYAAELQRSQLIQWAAIRDSLDAIDQSLCDLNFGREVAKGHPGYIELAPGFFLDKNTAAALSGFTPEHGTRRKDLAEQVASAILSLHIRPEDGVLPNFNMTIPNPNFRTGSEVVIDEPVRLYHGPGEPEPGTPFVVLFFGNHRYEVNGLRHDSLPPIMPSEISMAGYTYVLPSLPRPANLAPVIPIAHRQDVAQDVAEVEGWTPPGSDDDEEDEPPRDGYDY